jgi:catechol 2,3-dioxygenase-like lactoylglutathione lyase family enzyme
VIDHASIPTRALAPAGAFYDRVLAALGLTRLVERPRQLGYGKRYPELWLNLREDHVAPENPGHHLCLRAVDEATVLAFHAAALEAGGSSDGDPGPRPATMTGYYAAFIRGLDGNRLEAATFPHG